MNKDFSNPKIALKNVNLNRTLNQFQNIPASTQNFINQKAINDEMCYYSPFTKKTIKAKESLNAMLNKGNSQNQENIYFSLKTHIEQMNNTFNSTIASNKHSLSTFSSISPNTSIKYNQQNEVHQSNDEQNSKLLDTNKSFERQTSSSNSENRRQMSIEQSLARNEEQVKHLNYILEQQQLQYDIKKRQLKAQKDLIRRQLDQIKKNSGITQDEQLLKLMMEIKIFYEQERTDSFLNKESNERFNYLELIDSIKNISLLLSDEGSARTKSKERIYMLSEDLDSMVLRNVELIIEMENLQLNLGKIKEKYKYRNDIWGKLEFFFDNLEQSHLIDLCNRKIHLKTREMDTVKKMINHLKVNMQKQENQLAEFTQNINSISNEKEEIFFFQEYLQSQIDQPSLQILSLFKGIFEFSNLYQKLTMQKSLQASAFLELMCEFQNILILEIQSIFSYRQRQLEIKSMVSDGMQVYDPKNVGMTLAFQKTQYFEKYESQLRALHGQQEEEMSQIKEFKLKKIEELQKISCNRYPEIVSFMRTLLNLETLYKLLLKGIIALTDQGEVEKSRFQRIFILFLEKKKQTFTQLVEKSQSFEPKKKEALELQSQLGIRSNRVQELNIELLTLQKQLNQILSERNDIQKNGPSRSHKRIFSIAQTYDQTSPNSNSTIDSFISSVKNQRRTSNFSSTSSSDKYDLTSPIAGRSPHNSKISLLDGVKQAYELRQFQNGDANSETGVKIEKLKHQINQKYRRINDLQGLLKKNFEIIDSELQVEQICLDVQLKNSTNKIQTYLGNLHENLKKIAQIIPKPADCGRIIDFFIEQNQLLIQFFQTDVYTNQKNDTLQILAHLKNRETEINKEIQRIEEQSNLETNFINYELQAQNINIINYQKKLENFISQPREKLRSKSPKMKYDSKSFHISASPSPSNHQDFVEQKRYSFHEPNFKQHSHFGQNSSAMSTANTTPRYRENEMILNDIFEKFEKYQNELILKNQNPEVCKKNTHQIENNNFQNPHYLLISHRVQQSQVNPLNQQSFTSLESSSQSLHCNVIGNQLSQNESSKFKQKAPFAHIIDIQDSAFNTHNNSQIINSKVCSSHYQSNQNSFQESKSQIDFVQSPKIVNRSKEEQKTNHYDSSTVKDSLSNKIEEPMFSGELKITKDIPNEGQKVFDFSIERQKPSLAISAIPEESYKIRKEDISLVSKPEQTQNQEYIYTFGTPPPSGEQLRGKNIMEVTSKPFDSRPFEIQSFCVEPQNFSQASTISSQGVKIYLKLAIHKGIVNYNQKIFDPLLMNLNDAIKMGYAQRIMKYNQKSNSLELYKETFNKSRQMSMVQGDFENRNVSPSHQTYSTDTVNQVTKKMVLEKSYQLEQISKINIPRITNQILFCKQQNNLKNKNFTNSKQFQRHVNCNIYLLELEVLLEGFMQFIVIGDAQFSSTLRQLQKVIEK